MLFRSEHQEAQVLQEQAAQAAAAVLLDHQVQVEHLVAQVLLVHQAAAVRQEHLDLVGLLELRVHLSKQ